MPVRYRCWMNMARESSVDNLNILYSLNPFLLLGGWALALGFSYILSLLLDCYLTTVPKMAFVIYLAISGLIFNVEFPMVDKWTLFGAWLTVCAFAFIGYFFVYLYHIEND